MMSAQKLPSVWVASLTANHEEATQSGCAMRYPIISAHRTPDRLAEFARTAEQGFRLSLQAGGALIACMIAAQTHLPVLVCR